MNRVKKWIKEKAVPTQKSSETKADRSLALDWRLEGLEDRDRSYLEERMDPDFGLLDKLLVKNALTRRELNSIKSQTTFEMRNARLIDYISEKNNYHDLANALCDTHQSHLVNYLDSHGVYNPSFAGDWPLTDRETQILDSNHETLVDKLETTDLVWTLVAQQVINYRQKEFLAARQTTYEKGEALMQIVRRGSLADYRTVIDCLHKTNQSHIAEILERGGVVVSIHSSIHEEHKEDVILMEEEIVDKITHLLASRSPADSSRIWELVQLRLIGARLGQSIVLLFHCQTLSDLDGLRQSYASGDLREKVEAVFHRVTCAEKLEIQVLLRWPDDDYAKFRKHFLNVSQTPAEMACQQMFLDSSNSSAISDGTNRRTSGETDRKNTTIDLSITGINDLPVELLEMILEKFFLLNLTKRTSHPATDVFVSIAHVESFWFQLTARRKFRRTLWRHLSIFYSQLNKRSRIIRSNLTYLVENLKTGELVKRLRLTDCLNDKQVRSLNRLKDDKRKSEELLNLVKTSDATRYSAFVRCCREAGQRLSARVAENGGVVLKARVSSKSMERQRQERFRFLIQRINELQQKVKPRGEESEKLLKQLKSDGCEILGATEDRGIVVWLLVQRQFTLTTLKDSDRGPLNIVRRLLIHLCRLSYWNPGPVIGEGTVIVDGDHLRTDIVICSTVTRLLKRLEETAYIHGIARLQDSLYVLCHKPNVVRVYECRDSFSFHREIPLQQIVQPWDMATSPKFNRLYITDSHKKCVWKIEESSGQVEIWLRDVSSLQFTLSVTCDDQVLLATGGVHPPSLELYTPSAQLARSIRLPGHIFSPVHAVVTSSGFFIIIYGWWNSKRWGICMLNSDGQTVRQFASSDDSQQLNWPWHLALDADDGVFVADYENNRVILLDSELEWIKILLRQDTDGLTEPWRLHYSKNRKLLIVAHLRKVDVYALNQT